MKILQLNTQSQIALSRYYHTYLMYKDTLRILEEVFDYSMKPQLRLQEISTTKRMMENQLKSFKNVCDLYGVYPDEQWYAKLNEEVEQEERDEKWIIKKHWEYVSAFKKLYKDNKELIDQEIQEHLDLFKR